MRFAPYVLGVLVVLLTSFCLSYYLTTSGPRLAMPQEIDLGNQPIGTQIRVAAPLQNLGRNTLELSSFESSCGCISLEIRSEGERLQGESIEIPPHAECQLVLTVTSRGLPGSELREQINFKTNDPQNGAVALVVKFRVDGGIIAVPGILTCSEILVNEPCKKTVVLYNLKSESPFTIARVNSSRPNLISISGIKALIPNSNESDHGIQITDGVPIYAIDVVISSSSPSARFDEVIEIVSEQVGVTPIHVRILGSVVGRFGFSPRGALLPRNSEGGPIFSVKVDVWAFNGKSFQIDPVSVPDGLSVKIGHADSKGQDSITVACAPTWAEKNRQAIVTFWATQAGHTETFDIPILIRDLPR